MIEDGEGAGPRAAYERGRRSFELVAGALESRSRWLGGIRLSAVALFILAIAATVWSHDRVRAGLTAGGLVVVFAVLVVVHGRVDEAKERALAAVRFHTRALARMALDWAALPQGSERFRVPDHPFAYDLDIFGRASVMQIIDATETRFGQDRLAALLSTSSGGAWPDDVRARAEAVRELASRFAFREALATSAGVLADEKTDPSSFVRWAEGSDGALPALLLALAWALPVAVGAVIVAGEVRALSAGQVTTALAVAIAAGLAAGTRVNAMLEAVSARESAATRWQATMRIVEREPFESPLLVRLRGQLAEGRASDEMGALQRIVGFVDARRNEVFRFFVGPLLAWDVHCAAALLRWRARSGRRLAGWLAALGEVEALASLGAFAFEHPGFVWPELVSDPGIEAHGLGHPLIADGARVGNDVRIASAGRALVVTGSNMSGKSTLLRAIGVNVVLAGAGAPICARSMRLGPLRVATSMRVEDSLSHGVSHFYAELQRIKRVVDWAREPGAVLFLLDEILHGTNSRERILGARAIVRDLLEHGALGAVSTHDLGITALEQELGGKVENVHFEEQVSGTEMTFDYVLRPGVVQSSNALRLMRAMGIAVGDDT